MKLRIPRAVIVTSAERAPCLLMPNIYYHNQVIGVVVRLWPRRKPAHGHQMLSILWARPQVPGPLTCKVCGFVVPFEGDKRAQGGKAWEHWEAEHDLEPHDSEGADRG